MNTMQQGDKAVQEKIILLQKEKDQVILTRNSHIPVQFGHYLKTHLHLQGKVQASIIIIYGAIHLVCIL